MLWWHDGWGWWWPSMVIAMIVFYGFVFWAILALVRYLSAPERRESVRGPRRTTAGDILAERFARGEIDGDEYTRRLAVLRSPDHRAERSTEQGSATRDAESVAGV